MEIWIAVIGLMGTLVSAVATVIAARTAKSVENEQKQTAARAEKRAKESELSMELMYATCSLSLVTAKKMSGQHTNGDVEEAMERAKKAKKDYRSFVQSTAAKDFAEE